MTIQEYCRSWVETFEKRYGVLPTKMWVDHHRYESIRAAAYSHAMDFFGDAGTFPADEFNKPVAVTVCGIPLFEQ